MKHFIYIRDKRNNKNKFFKLESINFLFNDKNETSKKKSEAIPSKIGKKVTQLGQLSSSLLRNFFYPSGEKEKLNLT